MPTIRYVAQHCELKITEAECRLIQKLYKTGDCLLAAQFVAQQYSVGMDAAESICEAAVKVVLPMRGL